MIAIIDYGAGNLASVEKALRFIGCDVEITDDKNRIAAADGVILPGVGSFGDCMNSMRAKGLDSAVIQAANSGKPFLGICLGLQLLFEDSEESPGVPGLGILKGHIRRIPSDAGLKVTSAGTPCKSHSAKGFSVPLTKTHTFILCTLIIWTRQINRRLPQPRNTA